VLEHKPVQGRRCYRDQRDAPPAQQRESCDDHLKADADIKERHAQQGQPAIRGEHWEQESGMRRVIGHDHVEDHDDHQEHRSQ
jgi:hypothetical protein